MMCLRMTRKAKIDKRKILWTANEVINKGKENKLQNGKMFVNHASDLELAFQI